MTMLIVAFRNFVNAPKNGHYGILAKCDKKVVDPDMTPVCGTEAKSSSSVLT
jgi:hypothetical protein